MATPSPLSAAAQAAEDRPRLPIGATILVAALAAPVALLTVEKPTHLLLALAAAAVVVVSVARVEIALLLLVAAAPLEDAVRLSSNPQLTVTKLAGALCFASFALWALASGRRLSFDRTHAAVLLLLALALVSSLQAEEFGAATATAVRYASFVALYIVVSQFAGNHALQRRIAWVLSLAGGAAAMIALNEFLSGNTTQSRPPYGDPNDHAYMLATTLPLTLWLLGERRWRPVVLVLAAAMSASIALSFSRGALVGLAAALVWHVLTERRGQMLLLGGVIVLAAGTTFLLVQANPEQVQTGLRAKQKVATANVDTRVDAWRAATRLSLEHPILGVGPGNFRFHYLEETGRPAGTSNIGVVHNAYLDVAAELGLLGGILFLGYLAAVFARATAARRAGRGPPGMASALRTALVVAFVGALFLSEQYFAPFWLLGALATALWREGAPDARE
ncbi:MAG: O-antigen ligase family protein [Gaiellaceae bacterium]